MKPTPTKVSSKARKQTGQGIVEYALLMGLVSMVALASLASFGAGVSGMLNSACSALHGQLQKVASRSTSKPIRSTVAPPPRMQLQKVASRGTSNS